MFKKKLQLYKSSEGINDDGEVQEPHEMLIHYSCFAFFFFIEFSSLPKKCWEGCCDFYYPGEEAVVTDRRTANIMG